MNGSALPPKKIVALARIVHAANSEYSAVIGDNSHVPWDELSQEARQSTISGIVNVLDDPFITGEEIHKTWMEDKAATGWVYGTTKDEDGKTHPSMVDYNKLDVNQRFKDDLFIGIVNIYADFMEKGSPQSEVTPTEIETLRLLFISGPTEDGNLPSKSDRDSLCEKGFVFARNGFQSLTPKGLDLCLSMELDRVKEKETI